MAKAIISNKPHLFAYLDSDSNNFNSYYLHESTWSAKDLGKAKEILETRYQNLSINGIQYLKIIIPEKICVYPEYSPLDCQQKNLSQQRPAQLLDNQFEFVEYILPYIKSLKGFGNLYFRYDTHANWYGSWFIYRYILSSLKSRYCPQLEPFDLKAFAKELVPNQGDLVPHLSQLQSKQISSFLEHTFDANGLVELSTRITLGKELQKLLRTLKFHDKATATITRKVSHYSSDNPKRAGRALFFRDSTLDRGLDSWLGLHFKESLFIWHKGSVIKEIVESFDPEIVIHIMAERFTTSYSKNFAPFLSLQDILIKPGLP